MAKKAIVLNQSLVRLGALARDEGLEYDYIEKVLLRADNGRASWEAGWMQRDQELKRAKGRRNGE